MLKYTSYFASCPPQYLRLCISAVSALVEHSRMDAIHIILSYCEIVAFSVPNSAFSVIGWQLEVGQCGFNYIAPLRLPV